ncbi:Transcriptional regulator [Kibdelosporangium sp. 4NS15]|uniref:Transcriptional regulator n=2 Tax=Kibdelosporangium persicum TaxID=2698649 RepID=A0ABX2F3Z8_9PSEU|nr:Transcriptional regulator [Kibdelosporangium persicum]
MTQKEVADALEWSTSKIIRIETGGVGISKTDLIALLRHYGVEEQRVDELVEVARISRQSAWWDQYRDRFTPEFIRFIGYEQSAKLIRTFAALTIPGVLQTRAYATAILESFNTPVDRISLNVDVRLKRQELLDQADPPELFFILDEAVVRRWVGGPEVMREQLLKLKELNNHPHVSIQIARFDIGAYLGMKGSFGVLEFPQDQDYVVLVEHAHGDELIQNNPERASGFVATFFDLEALASPKSETDSILDEILATIPGGKPAKKGAAATTGS